MYKRNQKFIRSIGVFMLTAAILTGFSEKVSAGKTVSAKATSEADAIPGNGRHFVQYNGHVYFRIPSEDDMKKSAIWGNYADIPNSKGTIVAMDCKTLETEPLFEDMSQGRIVISGGRLILSSNSPSGQNNVRSVSLDGSDTKELPGTNIYGTQPSGKYFVTGGFNSKDHKLHLYICDEDGGYKEPVTSSKLYDYAGIGKTQLFCITKEKEGYGSLSGFDLETGEETVYGELPELQGTKKTPGSVSRCMEEDGYVYLQLVFYEGSSYIYKGSNCVKVKVGKAGSLEEIIPEETKKKDGEERYSRTVMVKDGKLLYVEGRPNTASLDPHGNIGFYNDDAEFVKVASGYETELTGEKDTRLSVETVEAVDGYIYVIQNKERRAQKDDDGLRYAYKRVETSFIRLDEKTGNKVTISHCENPDINNQDSDQAKDSDDDKIPNNDPLKGLVRGDILKRFRASNPYREGNGVQEEARRLGNWVKDSIKNHMPDSLKEQGESIGRKYEFYFGTDIGNNLNNNFPYIYMAYFTLKDYYFNGRNVEFYNGLIEDDSYLGSGDPETIDQMYKDMQAFITECNNYIRRK